ncbi:hypothetical protein [Micromonospora marina]|uniref:hypothetical protein n=1 Tax=Micromonospora marina TaxID=307120 RepID=UPI003452C56C
MDDTLTASMPAHTGRRARWGAVSHRTLLDALAASVPVSPYDWADAALVTGLLRPVTWDRHGLWSSIASTTHAALAARTARVVRPVVSDVTTVRQAARRGGRERAAFEVLVPTARLAAATGLSEDLCASLTGALGHRAPEAVALARTVWRTALLVASSDRRRAQLRVRVPDSPLAGVLVRAGELLDVEARHHRTRDRVHFVTVDDPTDAVAVLRAVGAGPRAEAWVRGRC